MKKTQTLRLLAALAVGIGGNAFSQDQSRELDAAIDSQRKDTLIIEAAPGTQVVVEQQRHEFWFGAALANQAFNGGMPPADRAKYLEVFLKNFNAAVTENALKWHSMEPLRGKVDYATVDAILAWTDQNHLPLRGHNIFWGVSDRVQNWLEALPDDELREALKSRALDIGSRYRGRFAEYDLNNAGSIANGGPNGTDRPTPKAGAGYALFSANIASGPAQKSW